MSIEQTKLFKKRIETPELRTNTFTSENLEGNNILADTIWFAGHDLEDTLFGDNIEEIVIDPIEIISEANTGAISYGAEQIIAFQMKVTQDYKGKYMTSVTLRRCDTNTGSGKPVAQLEQVYLYANFINSEGEVIDRFYSFDKHKQSQDDGLQTTWHFEEPIKISKDYEFIRFYCTRVHGEAQTNVNLRSSNIKIDDTRQYINGWKTVDQASVKEFTTDFCVNVYQRTTGLLDHVNDTTIHVTAEDKERWDNLEVELNAGSFIEIGENNTISVKTADTLSFDEKTVPTTKAMYLEMGYVLTDAQTYADEAVTGHRNQSGLHTSTLLQNKWNGHVDDDTIHVTTDEKDLLQTLVVPQTRLFSTKTDEMTTNEYANCLYFSISKKHFTQGKLQKIEIPYKSGGSVYSKIWLCLQFYNSATEVKTFEDCIFSKNYQNQTNTGGTLVFEFDNVQIPYEYSFVRIMLAQNSTPNSEEPPTTLPSGNLELRVTPLKTTTLTFDLDECEVKGKNGTIYNWLVYMNAETKVSFLDEYSLLLQEVKELKNRIEHLESNS